MIVTKRVRKTKANPKLQTLSKSNTQIQLIPLDVVPLTQLDIPLASLGITEVLDNKPPHILKSKDSNSPTIQNNIESLVDNMDALRSLNPVQQEQIIIIDSEDKAFVQVIDNREFAQPDGNKQIIQKQQNQEQTHLFEIPVQDNKLQQDIKSQINQELFLSNDIDTQVQQINIQNEVKSQQMQTLLLDTQQKTLKLLEPTTDKLIQGESNHIYDHNVLATGQIPLLPQEQALNKELRDFSLADDKGQQFSLPQDNQIKIPLSQAGSLLSLNGNVGIKQGIYTLKMHRLQARQMQYLNINTTHKLPGVVDLRYRFQRVLDQGQLGSCTANALVSLVEYTMPQMRGSRLFIYYNERSLEGTTKIDSGATIRDAVLALTNYGICQESSWPYDISQFTVRPPTKCYKEASEHKVLSYNHIPQDIYNIKNALNQGFPFAVGIRVFESFERQSTFKTGFVPLPNTHQEQYLGNHCIVICGYDDSKSCFIFLNSWGSDIYPMKGFGFIPYLYLLDSYLASDLYVITSFQK